MITSFFEILSDADDVVFDVFDACVQSHVRTVSFL